MGVKRGDLERMTKKNSWRGLVSILALGLLAAIFVFSAPMTAEAKIDLKANVAFNDSCFRCHGAQGLKLKEGDQVISLYVNEEDYYASQHATNRCTTCHTDIGNDYPHTGALKGEKLKELKKAVNANCQRCHADITKAYANSIHDKANKAGKEIYCWSCHGVHNIFKKELNTAVDYRANISNACGKCHNPEVMESYSESFHGKGTSLGSTTTANCADCHGTHEIVKAAAPNSPVNEKNVAKTCAKCHFRAEPNFAKGTEHWTFSRGGAGEPMYWVLKFLTWLTIGTIAVFIIHVELDLYRKLKNINKPNQH